jgi:hypothetical protein
VSQPLAEAGCATASITPGHGATITWTNSDYSLDAASPGDTYNPSGCSKQFIVEISGMQNDSDELQLEWRWDQPLPLTQAECKGWLQAGVYGLNSGVWSLLSTGRKTLSWHSAINVCAFDDGPNPYPKANAAYSTNSHEKMRVAMAAFTMPEGPTSRLDYKFVRLVVARPPK